MSLFPKKKWSMKSNTFVVLLAQLHYVILTDFNHVLVNVEIKC